MLSRRKWLKNSILGIAGGALLSPAELLALKTDQNQLVNQLQAIDPEEEAYWELIKSNFLVQEGLYYFNNASLGTAPEYVAKATERFRRTLDSFPSKYMWGGWNDEKEKVREQAGELFKVSPERLALIHNTTEGMNLIASSMQLNKGDEVLLSNHEHTSAKIPWKYWQEEKGIKLKTVEVPLIPSSKAEVVDAFRKAITPKTRVISIVHVTNTNGMILPVKEISELAHQNGILVAVDGAQSMGMFGIDMEDLGCDYFTSSTHKWIFSPKGMGLFYASEAAQKQLRQLIVCRGYNDKTIRKFENYNTRNLPELLGLGAALEYRALIGEERIEKRIYELKQYFRNKVGENPKLILKTPAPDDLSAGIQTVEVKGKKVRDVKKTLEEKYQIDCRPMTSHTLNGLRISLAIFTTKADVDYLIEALSTI